MKTTYKKNPRYKRYIVFSYEYTKSADGGFKDVEESFDDFREAKSAARYMKNHFHIFDCELRIIVFSNDGTCPRTVLTT